MTSSEHSNGDSSDLRAAVRKNYSADEATVLRDLIASIWALKFRASVLVFKPIKVFGVGHAPIKGVDNSVAIEVGDVGINMSGPTSHSGRGEEHGGKAAKRHPLHLDTQPRSEECFGRDAMAILANCQLFLCAASPCKTLHGIDEAGLF